LLSAYSPSGVFSLAAADDHQLAKNKGGYATSCLYIRKIPPNFEHFIHHIASFCGAGAGAADRDDLHLARGG